MQIRTAKDQQAELERQLAEQKRDADVDLNALRAEVAQLKQVWDGRCVRWRGLVTSVCACMYLITRV
jgi:hypothetical protein